MPENHELEKQIEELKALVIAQAKRPNDVESAVETSKKYIGWIQSVIAVAAVVIGLGINWGVTKTKIEVLEGTVDHMEQVLQGRLDKAENDVHELQLKQAGDDQILRVIQTDIAEIKKDVKQIIERRSR